MPEKPIRLQAQSGCFFNVIFMPCGEVANVVDEVRAAIGRRTVFVDIQDHKIDVSSTI
jgi:hypothetical protein